ncbi:HNH endonuclease-domain-containing protein [Tuber indicum]|nr:HNH endonuclease-domain-containing protein [Tuber indicum]
MPRIRASCWHNAFIYAADNRDEKFGGLWAGSTFTNSNFYCMVEILCIFSDTFVIHDKEGKLLEKDGQQLLEGDYYLLTVGSITVNDEVPLIRLPTLQSGSRVDSFTRAVRARDRRCIVTGIKVPLDYLGIWTGFEACHIFPLAYETQWKDNDYCSWITIPPAKESDGSINSVQNGILLSSHMHKFFDSYQIAINPNDNYKIVCFAPGPLEFGIAGRYLDETFLNNPLRPPVQLLRWHFHQAVLINMKGAGELSFGDDFHRDPDIVDGPFFNLHKEVYTFGDVYTV